MEESSNTPSSGPPASRPESLSVHSAESQDKASYGFPQHTQKTVPDWLGQARDPTSKSPAGDTVEPVRLSQRNHIGTFTFPHTARRTPYWSPFGEQHYDHRKDRLAELEAGLKSPPGESNESVGVLVDHSLRRQQTQNQPHSSDFTFSHKDPLSPALGFPSAVGAALDDMAAPRQAFADHTGTARIRRGFQADPLRRSREMDGEMQTPSADRAMPIEPSTHAHSRASRWDIGPPSHAGITHMSPGREAAAGGAARLPAQNDSPTPARPNPWYSGRLASDLFAVNRSVVSATRPQAVVNATTPSIAAGLPPAHPLPSTNTTDTLTKIEMCMICLDRAGSEAIQPCSKCYKYLCIPCLQSMVQDALKDMTMMPLQCCTMIQLAVMLPHISEEQADAYRAKFEEWRSSEKTYCPVLSCSAFISDRFMLPESRSTPKFWDSLKPRLPGLVKALIASPDSKYFRDVNSPKRYGLVDLHRLVPNTVFFDTIERRLPRYSSLRTLVDDLGRIFSYARRLRTQYSGASSAGARLEKLFFDELGDLMIELATAGVLRHPNACFACPKCHIGICNECKEVAHPLKPCDTSARDQELGMLAKFRYKQCPKCSHAVKKMYGCRHVQCRCGAHWCYYCLQSIIKCDAQGCMPGYEDEADSDSEREDEPMNQEMDEEIDEEINEVMDASQLLARQHANLGATVRELARAEALRNENAIHQGAHAYNAGTAGIPTHQPLQHEAPFRPSAYSAEFLMSMMARHRAIPAFSAADDMTAQPSPTQPSTVLSMSTIGVDVGNGATSSATQHTTTQSASAASVPTPLGATADNLDAGGARRWRQFNLGAEPDEPTTTENAWSCQHRFDAFEITRGHVETGYPIKVECNRCFNGDIYAKIIEDSKTRRSSGQEGGYTQSSMARECGVCGLVVCKKCEQHFVENKGASVWQSSSRRGA